jgi:hypothetical protein
MCCPSGKVTIAARSWQEPTHFKSSLQLPLLLEPFTGWTIISRAKSSRLANEERTKQAEKTQSIHQQLPGAWFIARIIKQENSLKRDFFVAAVASK